MTRSPSEPWAQFVEDVQSRQGLYIACLEEITYSKGWIGWDALRRLGESMKAAEYGQYILSLRENS